MFVLHVHIFYSPGGQKKCPVSCVLCPFDESQNRNYARAKSVTGLYIVFFSFDTKLGQEYLQEQVSDESPPML